MERKQGYYAIRLTQERGPEGDFWTAEHPHLLGCHVVRKDPQQALDDLAIAREEWIERALTDGRKVPDPQRDLKYELVLATDHTAEEAAVASRAISTAGMATPLVWL